MHLAAGPLRSEQGWKVHVSALPGDAATVAAVCFDACVKLTVPLKVQRSRGLVLAGQQKYTPWTAGGKVVTCYPEPDQLEPLCTLLVEQLSGFQAPRVLGELRVPGAPITLRHGAFRGRWMPAADGTPVPAITIGGADHPDLRGVPTGPLPDEPEYVTRLRAAGSAEDAAQRMDVTDVRLVHRSNAGGVYRARTSAGKPVLLKEARHFSGLDLGGSTAPDRLRHEHDALRRLSGSGVAPEVVEYLTVGDSDFLVMDFVEGTPINTAVAARHPVLRSESGTGAAYVGWVERVHADARRAVAQLHERGVVHRDLQPANLIDTGDGVMVVDLESCAVDGVVVSRGVASPGFSDDRFGAAPDDDLRSLERVRSMMVNPLTPLLHRRRDLEREMLATGFADLGVAQAPTDVVPAPDAGRIAAGIVASATPERADRLFPGDALQFMVPRGGLGLLHGAAGVLLALDTCGHGRDEVRDAAWTGWLAEHALLPGPFPRGLGDGVEGVAWALARLGRLDAAAELVDRYVLGAEAARPATVPWWRHGTAGRALAVAALAELLDRADLRALASAEAVTTTAAVRADATPPGYRAGLNSGWGGVGLALLAMRVPDAVQLAFRALERELGACRRRGPCLLSADGTTLLPYLGNGSAAAGLLAARLLDEPELPEQARAVAAETVAGVLAACSCPVAGFAGLQTGRAGMLVVVDALSRGRDPMAAEHRRRLDWHTVELRRDDADGRPALGVLGEQNLRCSADLATGAAGVLVALGPDPAVHLAGLFYVPGQATH